MAQSPSTAREFDIVLFGATGFTGGLTAAYLADNAPSKLRWALAGRNRTKLEDVRTRLGKPDLELIEADVNDEASLAALAARTKSIVTTVGPYLEYGEPLVKACAEAGTDYLDLTGEPEFVDRMYVKYHRIAVESGARLIHACGFDSIPHDIGALFTVKELGGDGPITVRGVVRSNGTFSGGTFHSALSQMSRGRQMVAAAKERRAMEERNPRVHLKAGKPSKDPVLGYYLLPLPTIDPAIVGRSASLRGDYGSDFTYSHYAGTKTIAYAAGGSVAVAGLLGAAQIKPVRNFLGSKVPQGTGPSESKRNATWFTVDFVGESLGRQVHTRISGGDPGYTETSRMLAEAALCLALDKNPKTAGQVTPAAAMGENLQKRLEKFLKFEVL